MIGVKQACSVNCTLTLLRIPCLHSSCSASCRPSWLPANWHALPPLSTSLAQGLLLSGEGLGERDRVLGRLEGMKNDLTTVGGYDEIGG